MQKRPSYSSVKESFEEKQNKLVLEQIQQSCPEIYKLVLKARADSTSYRGKIPMTRLKIQGNYYYNIDYSHRSYDGIDPLYDCDGKIHCSFGGKIINPTYDCENFMQSATEKISFY